MISLLAPLLGLAFVYWVIAGGPARRADTRRSMRRRGGRPVASRGFWSLPARDRDYIPGVVLVVFAATTLAETVADASIRPSGASAQTTTILGAILAVAHRYRPDLVSAGLAVVGVASLAVQRLGAGPCGDVFTLGQNRTWLLSFAAVVAMVLVVRTVIAPITAARQVLISPSSAWSVGGSARASAFGRSALAVFGLLDVLDIVLSPTGVDLLGERWGSSPLVGIAAAAGAAVLALGIAVVPGFTASMMGVVVFAATTAELSSGTSCHDAGPLLLIAVVFAAISTLARRLP